jgi:prevent-host-death family protein
METTHMEKIVSAFDARRQFGKVLDTVAGKGDSVVVERHGQAVAAVVPIERYNQWKQERERFLEALDTAQLHADLSPEEAERVALEVVAQARLARRQHNAVR